MCLADTPTGTRYPGSFSEDFFYKELVYADLKFVPEGGTEIELADLIINLEDVILAIQLKERNERVLSKQASETRNFGTSIFI